MIDTSYSCWLKDECYSKKKKQCLNEDIFCLKLFKLTNLYNSSLLPNKYKNKLLLYTEEVDSESYYELNNIKNNIKDFVDNGNNLYIYSIICGNGKTSWAAKLIKAYFNSIWMESNLENKALFINVPRFLLALKDNISNKNEYIKHVLTNVNNSNLVIWDDIATKSITEFESEHLLSIIDNRISNTKSNIFTSNMDARAVYDLLGARLASRIINSSINIELKGKDKRNFKGVENIN